MVIKEILKQADQKLRTLLTMSLYLSNDEKNLDVSILNLDKENLLHQTKWLSGLGHYCYMHKVMKISLSYRGLIFKLRREELVAFSFRVL